MPENEVLTREELQKAYSETYPHLPDFEVEGMVDSQIEEMYGDRESYERRLATQTKQQVQAEIEEEQYADITADFADIASDVQDKFLPELEERKTRLMFDFDISPSEAERLAKAGLIEEYGEDALPSLDKQIDRLVATGHDIKGYKAKIKAMANVHGLNVVEAYRRVRSEEREAQAELDGMSATEREYYNLLSNEDKNAVAGLRAGNSESWGKGAYQKYYSLMYGDKPKPKSKPVPTAEELRLQAAIEQEQRRTERLRRQFLNNGGTEAAWNTLMGEGA